MLLTYGFTNSHGYPVIFPVFYFQFGQTGQYMALLALALAACGWPLAAGFFGGLLAGVHAVWCAAFAIGAFPIIAWFQPRQLTRLALAFVISVTGALLLQGFGESVMPPRLQLSVPPIPAGAGSTPIKSMLASASSDQSSPRNETLMAETGTSSANQTPASPEPKKKRRTTYQGHNILFSDAPSPLQAAFDFFLPEIVFAALLAAYFFALGGTTRANDVHFFDGYRLSAMAAIPIGAVILFKLIEELDPDLALLGAVDPRIPYFLMRAILPRWLNLSSLLIPILALSLLAVLAREKRSWLAAIGLAAFLIVVVIKSRAVGIVSQWFLVPDLLTGSTWISFAQALLPLILVAVIMARLPGHRSPGMARGPSVIVAAALAFLFVAKVAHLAVPAYAEQRYRGSDAADALVAEAKRDSGALIIAPEVHATRGFNPQLRTGRAMLPPLYLNIYDQEARKIIAVFCYTDRYLPFAEFYANIRPCFENRPPREWAVVRREARATGLITPDTWRLKIPVATSSGGFSYYRLPSAEEGTNP